MYIHYFAKLIASAVFVTSILIIVIFTEQRDFKTAWKFVSISETKAKNRLDTQDTDKLNLIRMRLQELV